jgi:EF-P beta-lysylation protein EpmB
MPKSAPTLNISTTWQAQLAQAITDPLQLLQRLQLDPADFPHCQQAHADFALKVPQAYVAKMTPGDARDPLLLQVMASGRELENVSGFVADPVGDLDAARTPGLLHKYQGRVLLITTAACAVHCRYCFRRHFPYEQQQPARQHWQAALEYIQTHRDIHEVILSGGDPLSLADNRLAELVDQLGHIEHLKRLRLHTRLPVVLPDRITDSLINTLSTNRLQTCMVIHANHARELGDTEQRALTRLSRVGIQLLNQSVLLRDVNDSADTLSHLSERLYECTVLPYYLHLLDPVAGAAHFDVKHADALYILNELRARLPGYLVPRLVREQAGENSKTPVFEL